MRLGDVGIPAAPSPHDADHPSAHDGAGASGAIQADDAPRGAERLLGAGASTDILSAKHWHLAYRHEYSLCDPERIALVFLFLPTGVTFLPPDRAPIVTHGPLRVGIAPPALPVRWRCAGEMEYLVVSFAGLPLHSTWSTAGFRFCDDDKGLYAMGRALASELAAGAEILRAEAAAWITLLGSHLRRHLSVACTGARASAELGALRAAAAFVERNLQAPLRGEDLAAAANLPRARFARLFKEWTGLTPHRYVLAKRVERARELLSSSADSLPDIAAAVGFSSQSHMTSTFRKLMSTTPREFRSSRQHAGAKRPNRRAGRPRARP